MKILFVADTYYPHVNGVFYFVQRLANGLQKSGYEVAVLAPSNCSKYKITEVDGIKLYGVASLSMPFYNSIRIPIPVGLKKQIEQVMDEFKPDVIHLQGHFALSKTVLTVNKNYHVPVMGTNHFMTENLICFIPGKKLQNIAAKLLWIDFSKVFNKMLFVTTPTLTGAMLIRPRLKVKVIPVSNGIDLIKFSTSNILENIRKKYSIPSKPILLSVGRLDPEKHISEVLKAAAIALKKTDFCLVICGKGLVKKSLEQLAVKLGIQKNVVFTGFVPDEDLRCLYQLSNCFITASIAELQSLVTMEAMACGLPVIAVDAGALGELVKNRVNGFLVLPGALEQLAAAIANICSNATLQTRMGEMSREIISEHAIGKTIVKYRELYSAATRKEQVHSLKEFLEKKTETEIV